MLAIGELSIIGIKFHSRKSNKYRPTSKKYAYHVYKMAQYLDILELTLAPDDLRNKFKRGN